MFTAALSVIAKYALSLGEWLNKSWYIYPSNKMEYTNDIHNMNESQNNYTE